MVNQLYNSLEKYFNVISRTGYKSYDQVLNLIVLIFIEELMTGPLSYYITEEDYKHISNAMYCMYGTCLIPYPTYKIGMEPIKSKSYKYRITEDNNIRQTTESLLRYE